MGKILSIQSFRGGTGKTTVAANLGYLLAAQGHRVAVMDLDVQSPGVHHLLGCNTEFPLTVTDFLGAQCGIEDAAYDLGRCLGIAGRGAFFLLPASPALGPMLRLVRGYDTTRLHGVLPGLVEHLQLDLLIVDTHAGINRETLFCANVADQVLLLACPDRQDQRGNVVLRELADKLHLDDVAVLVNKLPGSLDPGRVAAEFRAVTGHEVVGTLPLDLDLAAFGSRGLFTRHHPEHAFAAAMGAVAEAVLDTNAVPTRLTCAAPA